MSEKKEFFPVMFISREDLKEAIKLKGGDKKPPTEKEMEEIDKYSDEHMEEIASLIQDEMEYDESFMETYWEILKKYKYLLEEYGECKKP